MDERQDIKAQRNYNELLLNKGQSGTRDSETSQDYKWFTALYFSLPQPILLIFFFFLRSLSLPTFQ